MNTTARLNYGKTYTKQVMPWGLYAQSGHRVMCSDGVIRACRMAATADTFFSVPASIRIKGKTVSGYVTAEEQVWIKGEKESEPFLRVHSFRHHSKHCTTSGGVMPPWPVSSSSDDDARRYNAIIASAHS